MPVMNLKRIRTLQRARARPSDRESADLDLHEGLTQVIHAGGGLARDVYRRLDLRSTVKTQVTAGSRLRKRWWKLIWKWARLIRVSRNWAVKPLFHPDSSGYRPGRSLDAGH